MKKSSNSNGDNGNNNGSTKGRRTFSRNNPPPAPVQDTDTIPATILAQVVVLPTPPAPMAQEPAPAPDLTPAVVLAPPTPVAPAARPPTLTLVPTPPATPEALPAAVVHACVCVNCGAALPVGAAADGTIITVPEGQGVHYNKYPGSVRCSPHCKKPYDPDTAKTRTKANATLLGRGWTWHEGQRPEPRDIAPRPGRTTTTAAATVATTIATADLSRGVWIYGTDGLEVPWDQAVSAAAMPGAVVRHVRTETIEIALPWGGILKASR